LNDLIALRPRAFYFYAPKTLDEAINLLYTKEDAKALAGGQSLIPMMKLRILNPKNVVSLSKVSEIQPEITKKNDEVYVSALTTHDQICRSDVLLSHFPALSVAAKEIADQQIRNRGTIGGNVSHGDPSANLPIALLALDAKVHTKGPKGSRMLPVDEFYKDIFLTALEPGEVVTGFSLSVQKAGKQAFMKVTKTATTWPIVSVAVNVFLKEGVVESARIALGVAGPTPLRAKKAEEYLKGKTLDDETILKASQLSIEGVRPPEDVNASSDYRKHLLSVLVKRCLKQVSGR
jgi:carbon-monoxide dehydrogenase medium subunit